MKSKILQGDCIDIMETFEDNSIDSLVGDGPYGLGFMQRKWDIFTSKEYQDFCFKWGSKALKVLKPGGYCLSFSAPRKYHRMVCGLEDAGFKIKDMISWNFGSGFPKSLDISLAINKLLGGSIERGDMLIAPDGQSYDKRKKIGHPLTDNCYKGHIIENKDLYEKIPSNPEALRWSSWGTGLKPAHEPIVLAQKPYEGTYAKNILKWGVGGLYIDGCRIQYTPERETDSRVGTNKTWGGKREASKHTVSLPAIEGMQMYKNKGRWPSNLILTHHPECVLIGKKRVRTSTLLKEHDVKHPKYDMFSTLHNKRFLTKDYGKNGYDIVANYQCHSDCPVRMIDEQSGNLPPSGRPNLIGKDYRSIMFGANLGGQFKANRQHMDRGGASRFFYCPKAYKNERNAGCENLYWEKINKEFKQIIKKQYDLLPSDDRSKGNPVATLKPINLMRYLVRLVTPPNGTVLDPFAGSGTTGIACVIEGFNCVLIEKRESFAKIIIPKRLEYWKNSSNWRKLNEHPLLPNMDIKIKNKQNRNLRNWL